MIQNYAPVNLLFAGQWTGGESSINQQRTSAVTSISARSSIIQQMMIFVDLVLYGENVWKLELLVSSNGSYITGMFYLWWKSKTFFHSVWLWKLNCSWMICFAVTRQPPLSQKFFFFSELWAFELKCEFSKVFFGIFAKTWEKAILPEHKTKLPVT